jgi:hypothetical protein
MVTMDEEIAALLLENGADPNVKDCSILHSIFSPRHGPQTLPCCDCYLTKEPDSTSITKRDPRRTAVVPGEMSIRKREAFSRRLRRG